MLGKVRRWGDGGEGEKRGRREREKEERGGREIQSLTFYNVAIIIRVTCTYIIIVIHMYIGPSTSYHYTNLTVVRPSVVGLGRYTRQPTDSPAMALAAD